MQKYVGVLTDYESTIYRKAREQDANANLHHHATTTATGTLRSHLGKSHRVEYDRFCAQNGCKNYLNEADIQKAAKAKEVVQVAKRETFSVDGLMKCIVKFIVADDQVRIIIFSAISY